MSNQSRSALGSRPVEGSYNVKKRYTTGLIIPHHLLLAFGVWHEDRRLLPLLELSLHLVSSKPSKYSDFEGGIRRCAYHLQLNIAYIVWASTYITLSNQLSLPDIHPSPVYSTRPTSFTSPRATPFCSPFCSRHQAHAACFTSQQPLSIVSKPRLYLSDLGSIIDFPHNPDPICEIGL
ncbi:unnamed protein product [Periconia digitata]|uniref:Uncharacterized protein n=1 Tax=Periconia digitata TaxID=1303443 RepID=A0A9W4UKM2_9PLEO|nr:unnamed protein product [Periconia digitata]